MSIQNLMAQRLAEKQAATTEGAADSSAVTIPPKAHEQALEQGLAVYKDLGLKRFFLSSGEVVVPTKEGYFIALNEDMASQLAYYSTFYNKVQVVPAIK